MLWQLVKLLESKEANHIEFSRIKHMVDEVMLMYKNDQLYPILQFLMDPTWTATGLRMEPEILVSGLPLFSNCFESVSKLSILFIPSCQPYFLVSMNRKEKLVFYCYHILNGTVRGKNALCSVKVWYCQSGLESSNSINDDTISCWREIAGDKPMLCPTLGSSSILLLALILFFCFDKRPSVNLTLQISDDFSLWYWLLFFPRSRSVN